MAKGDFTRSFAEWMRGRNGADDVARLSTWVALVFFLIGLLTANTVCEVIALALLVYSQWRMMSKNIAKRARENEAFMSALGPVRPWVVSPRAAWTESRSFKHLACPSCGQKVRVPRGKGTVRITCPKCHQKFDAKA
jgi:ribosomal protein S27AE